MPKGSIANCFFRITEKDILRNIIHRDEVCGKIVDQETDDNRIEKTSQTEQKIIHFVKMKRLQLLFWARDLVWSTGKWKSSGLIEFVDSFKPDIIFAPLYKWIFINQLLCFLKEHTGVPMVGYSSDDDYTFHQISYSPLFWIDLLIRRVFYRKAVEKCEFLYVITEKQKREYEILFKKRCSLLTKGSDFSTSSVFFNSIHKSCDGVKNLVYMGNLGLERWKSLGEVVDVVEEINKLYDRPQYRVSIYSLTERSKQMENVLNKDNVSKLMDPVPSSEIKSVLNDSFAVLHVEPRNKKERLKYRLSFSTKIVDYFSQKKCIIAYGGDTGTTDYLMENDAALIATNKTELKSLLDCMLADEKIVREYENKSWDCGKRNHDIQKIQQSLYHDLEELIHSKGEK